MNSMESDLQNELTPDQLNNTKPARKPKLISMWDAADTVTQPDWLIKNYFEMDTLAGLFAPPASCKSMLAIDLAASVATGRDWHGYRVKQGAVVYVAGEGGSGLLKRTKAWKIRNRANGCDVPLYLHSQAIDGQDLVEIHALIQSVESFHDIKESSINLVIIDTVARNFGGEENSAKDMGAFIKHMDAIRNRWQCAVLLVHHTGHSEVNRARGSSAFRAALDAEYVVKKEEKSVEFKSTKMKDAEEPNPLNFELCSVDLGIQDEDGDAVNSAVLDLTDKELPEKTETKKTRLVANHQAALGILEGMYSEYRERLSNQGQNPDNAHVQTVDWRRRCIDAGCTDTKNWSRLSKALEEKGFILRRDSFVFVMDCQ